MSKKAFLFVTVILLMLAGCATPATTAPTARMAEATPTEAAMMQASPTVEVMMGNPTTTPEAMMASPTQGMPNTGGTSAAGMMENGTATPEAMMTAAGSMTGTMMAEGTPTGMMADNAWLKISLADAVSGKTFTLNDFHGKTVLVELISTDCPACLQQQKSIQTYLAGAGSHIVVVTLDIPSIGAPSLGSPSSSMTGSLKDHVAMNHFNWSFAEATDELVKQIGNQYGSQYVEPANTPLLLIDPMGNVHPLPLHLTSPQDIQNAIPKM